MSEKCRFISVALSVVLVIGVVSVFAGEALVKTADAQKLLARGQTQFSDHDFTMARGTLWKAYENRAVLNESQKTALSNLLGEVDVAISESVKARSSLAEADKAMKAGTPDAARSELKTVADCRYLSDAEKTQARQMLAKIDADAAAETDNTRALATADSSKTNALELGVADKADKAPAPIVIAAKDDKADNAPAPIVIAAKDDKADNAPAPIVIAAKDDKAVKRKAVEDLTSKGEAALKNNQPDKAKKFFGDALAIDSSNEDVRKKLNYAHQQADVTTSSPSSVLSDLARSQSIDRQMTIGQINRALKEARQGIAAKSTSTTDYGNALQKAKYAKSVLLNKKRLFTAAENREKLAEIDECIAWISGEQEKWNNVQLKKTMAQIGRDAATRRQKTMEQRQQKLFGMQQRVKSLVQEKKLEQAIEVLDQMLELDVNYTWASSVKYGLQQALVLKVQREYNNTRAYQQSQVAADILGSEIPWFRKIRYPKDWKELTERRKKYGASRSGETEANRQLRAKLNIRVSPEFDGQAFPDVIEYFRETSDANIYVNWKAIEEAGIDRDQTVDVKLKNVPFFKALRLVLDDVGGAAAELAYALNDGVLTISTQSDLDRNKDTRVYDIRDLIARVPDFAGQRVSLSAIGESSGGEGGSSSSLFDDEGDEDETGEDEELTRSGAIARIKQLIVETIDPGNWRPEGDKGSIVSMHGNLVITQTPENHSEIEKLIATLRESRAIQVTVEARFIVVQTGFLSQIGVDLDFYFNLGGQISTNAPTTAYGPSAWTTAGYHAASTTSKFSPVSVENQSSTFANVAQESTIVDGGIGATMTALAMDSAMTIAGTFLDDIQVDFLIEATQAHQATRTLTAPRLTLYNGQRAYVNIQTSQAYISGIEQIVSENESAPEPEISYAPNGAMLDVDATVSHDRRYVQLTLRPQVIRTEITNSSMVTNVLISLPTVTLQEIQTTVSVPDGGTLLIGGQKISEEIEREMGVPILSKLPVINRAFTNKGKLRDEKTLLILIKPQIIILDEAEEDEKLHDEDPLFGKGYH
ncbi:MAG: hypothetical protein KAR11_00725 [Phycisphaerae bacterium]|nr:hypothetical protein [Phycisphaerae bacterium]